MINKTYFLSVLGLLAGHVCFSQVVINEILASNQNDIVDEFLQTADWIEIYNSTGSELDLAGYYLSDDELNLQKWPFPDDEPDETIIPAGGHLIVWADNDPADGPLHTNFRLSADGETLMLTAPDGTTVLDFKEFGSQQSDISFGRSTDGASDWIFFDNTTPGASNMEINPPASTVFINEVMAFNLNNIADNFEEREGWIEIYNPNPNQVNLANYYIGTPGDPTAFQIPDQNPVLTTVDGGGFLIFWMDGQTEQGEHHVNWELSVGGGAVVLTAPNGTSTINQYSFPEAEINKSWGRSSDGGLGSQSFDIPTPRVTNALVIEEPEELYINELMGANQNDITDEFDEFEDWVEIYNPNNYEVDLGGYYLSDNPENPMKWMVPDNVPDETTIPPNSWLLLWADEDGIQGPLHMSFRLNNQGEDLRLYSTDGFTLADRIVFPYIAPDESYGRLTDGNADWIHFEETTPDASNNGATTDIFELNDLELNVYPNPANGNIFLSKQALVNVYSVSGRLVYRSDFLQKQIDCSSWPSGLYFIKAQGFKTQRVSVLNR